MLRLIGSFQGTCPSQCGNGVVEGDEDCDLTDLGGSDCAAVGMAGRWIRRGVSAAGFSWADRAGGGVLGAAEGALLVVVVVGLATTFLGRDHESVRGSRSLAALEHLESMARERDIDVSAPPLSF